MTKIAIISQPEQGVLIDVGGCDSLQEATQHLSSTFQVTNQFWQDQSVDLNLGKLQLSTDELAQILAILSDRGVKPRSVRSEEEATVEALRAHNLIPPPPEQNPEALGKWGESKQGTAGDTAAPVEEDKPAEAKEEEKPSVPPAPPVPAVLYLRQTLRSGQSVSHKGHLIIIGDVNPGAEVSAEGDITIWGALRGIAHAGTAGNTSAEIRALCFDPIQLRIAQAIARSPDRPKASLRSTGPETARIVNGTIRISSSAPE